MSIQHDSRGRQQPGADLSQLKAPSFDLGPKVLEELQRGLNSLRRLNLEQEGDTQQVGNLLYSAGMRIARQMQTNPSGDMLPDAQQLLKRVHAFNASCRERRTDGLSSEESLEVSMPKAPGRS